MNDLNHIYSGILFIGDPHSGSRKPGRRKDDDYIFTSTNKLDQSLEIAREKNLLPVCLGDLIDRQKENNILLISNMLKALMKSKDIIIPLGNHDKSEIEDYSSSDLISVIDSLDVFNIVKEPCVVGTFNIKSEFDKSPSKVGLYCVPYGFDIPDDISDEFDEETDHVFMITHHDLAFDPVFAHIDMKEIKGCDHVVNGHLHKTFPYQDFGTTRWFNPGNILRVSVTELDHEPAVWSWTNGQTELQKNVLEYNKEIFDLTGYNVKAADHIPMDHHSVFVDILKSETNMEATASEDGSILEEDLNKIIDTKELDPKSDIVRVIQTLHKKAVSEINEDDDMEDVVSSVSALKM